MNLILVILGLLLLLAAGLYLYAPHPPRAATQAKSLAEIEAYFERLVKSGSPPGLSLSVVKGGKIVYTHAFGNADAPHGAKATAATIYHWWSMTKIPTALAVMQLHEQGRLSLDDPLVKHLPWFELKDPPGGMPAITLRHLLQHSSGLPDTMPAMIGWVHYDDQRRDQTEVTRKHLAQFNRLKFTPGTKAVYSNYNYMLLGAVIEAVAGQPYEAYITENILEPLGMAHTRFAVTAEMAAYEAAGTLPVVHFYTPLLPALLDARALIRQRQGKLFWLRRVYIDATPSTGLIGPATDMARFILAYLNGGEIDAQRILRPESIAMLSETAPLEGHGLGWFVGESKGERFLEHAGGGPGFATILRLYPAEGLGIAILSNGTDLDRSRLVELLASWDWPK
jgi:CubicO group peptidase (beta-lactamase class C family)